LDGVDLGAERGGKKYYEKERNTPTHNRFL
jgi:hypothetical protein